MILRIISIQAFWIGKEINEEYNLQDDKELFSWTDCGKPIIIFYYNNWFGKTTLFEFIKDTFLGKKINDTFVSIFKIKIELESQEYEIINSRIEGVKIINQKMEITYDEFKKILEDKVLHKNEKLAVAWNNDSWEQQRNTFESLLRFNFFSDDEFKKYSSKECSLINSDMDWDTKWFLFNYILWEDFKDKEELFKIAYKYWARQKILENTAYVEKKYPEQFEESIQKEIFASPEEDFNNLLKKKFLTKDNLLQIESVILKLRELENQNRLFLESNQYVTIIINDELEHLEEKKKNIEKEYENINARITDLKDNYSDLIKWIPTQIQNDISKRKEARNFVRKHQKAIEEYFDSENGLLNEYKRDFLMALTNWIFEYKNLWFDSRKLRLSISWATEKKWDWRLKTFRFLALVAIILFKSKQKNARNLGIWFLDSPFYGVDMINSIGALKSISKFVESNIISTQLFIFATKEEKKENNDSFQEDLRNDKNIYFHEYDLEKEYLFS